MDLGGLIVDILDKKLLLAIVTDDKNEVENAIDCPPRLGPLGFSAGMLGASCHRLRHQREQNHTKVTP